MADGDGSRTSPTLLGRLRASPADQEAWGAFVDRYGRMVYGWCRHWGLPEADAQDVTQNVLLDLARQMARFEYRRSGSFRAWLRTIAHRAWCDYLDARRRTVPATGDDTVLNCLGNGAGADLLARLEEECERELLAEAMARVRLRVRPHTWAAFQLTALDGLSGAEAAGRLGMNVGAVFVARSKVQKMLREEVDHLDVPGAE